MPLMPAAQVIAQAVAMAQLYDSLLSASAASWDVQNISQAYNHLRVVLLVRSDHVVSTASNKIRFNNDSTALYDSNDVATSGAATVANSEAFAATSSNVGQYTGTTATASLAGTVEFVIPNYANTTFFKSFVGSSFCDRGASGSIANQAFGGAWRSTAAINRITIFPTSGNYIAGSRCTIYGMI